MFLQHLTINYSEFSQSCQSRGQRLLGPDSTVPKESLSLFTLSASRVSITSFILYVFFYPQIIISFIIPFCFPTLSQTFEGETIEVVTNAFFNLKNILHILVGGQEYLVNSISWADHPAKPQASLPS